MRVLLINTRKNKRKINKEIYFKLYSGQGMKKAIMSILTVWMLVNSVFIGLIGFGGIENVKAPYVSHNPIRINNNAEFASMAGIESWVGDGSPGNPYIIEGYEINGSGYGYCIYIGNTTVYFEVRDCYLHEASGIGSDPYYPDSGIMLYNVQNSTIANNTALNNRDGIMLPYSDNNTIVNNNVSSNDWRGVFLFSSSNNAITNNTASSNNWEGIYQSSSSNNTINNNTISSNNGYGIYISSSSSNTIVFNKMLDNGIGIFGDMLEHWNTHIIDTTNTVNGKPVHYWKNQNGGTVPLGAGQVILANSTNVVVENQNVSDGAFGIELGFSSNNTIDNNTVSSNYGAGIVLYYSNNNTIINNNASNNWDGLFLFTSSSNTITNNNASNNRVGIFLSYASGNIITNNTASSNNDYGITLFSASNSTITNNTASNNIIGIYLDWMSNNNTITNNTVSNNSNYGIYLDSSGTNTIYHNNFIDNANQAFDNTNNSNQWENGYPLGGNYWSDNIGNDSFKGPNQDIPGGDGIGDTPYIIDADSQDNYPLMQPYKPFENYIMLKQGWNLISLPFIQEEQNLTRVLGSIDSWYDAVQWYDSSNPNKSWMHNKVGKPFGNDLFKLNETMGFWIHISNPGDTIFLYNGTQPTSNQSITLHPGWNMVGYPSLSNKNRTAALNNLTFGVEVDAVWTFNNANKNWEEVKAGDYFEGGRGYWVHAVQACVWEVGV